MPIEAAPLPIPEHGNERVEHAEVPLTEVKWQHCSGHEVGPPTAAPIRRESAEVTVFRDCFNQPDLGQPRGFDENAADCDTDRAFAGFLPTVSHTPAVARAGYLVHRNIHFVYLTPGDPQSRTGNLRPVTIMPVPSDGSL